MSTRNVVIGLFIVAAIAANANSQQTDNPPTASPPSAPVPSAVVQKAIENAKTEQGDPYEWGAEGPNAFDCSGLMQWAYGHAGVKLPRVSRDQYNAGDHFPLTEARPGDLVFWKRNPSKPGVISHVALYIGNNEIIEASGRREVREASDRGETVRIRSISPKEKGIVPFVTRPRIK